MKQLFLYTLLLAAAAAARAQGAASVSAPGINVAEHVPPSPTAAGISRYFDVPVTLQTGQPRISIPIYTIKSGSITVPVSLSYHAGGVKVNDHSGWAGQGWSIETAGSIQKRINGFDDFGSNTGSGNSQLQNYVQPDYASYGMPFSNLSDLVDSSLSSGTMTQLQRAVFFCRVANGNLDGEADEYFYSTPEGSGRLMYSQQHQQFEFDKYNGWQVQHSFSDLAHSDVQQFVLQSTGGLVYTFGEGDYYANPWFLRQIPAGSTSPSKTYFNQGWLLSSIQDVVHNKQVQFFNELAVHTSRNGFSVNRVYQQLMNGTTSPWTYKSETIEENLRLGTEVTPTEIHFDGGRVLFIKDTAARPDGGTKALKEIQVRTSSDKIVKRFRFGYSWQQSSIASCGYQHYQFGGWQAISDTLARRMYLSSVQEFNYDSSGAELALPPYTFSYHNINQLPARTSFAQDMWGYYNGQNGNTTALGSLPALPMYASVTGLANRQVDTAYTRCGSLKQINYPSGGSLRLELENHEADGQPVGGLRVRSITQTDNITGKTLVTRYRYGNGSLRYPATHHYMYMNYQGWAGGNVARELSISSESLYPLTAGQGSPVLYPVVTRVLDGGGADTLVSKHYFGNVVQPGYGQAQGSDLTVPRPKYPALEGFMGIEDKTEIYGPGGQLQQQDSSVYAPLHQFKQHIWNVQAAFATPDFMTEWAIWPGNDVFSTTPPNLGAATNFYAHFKESAVKTAGVQTVYDGGIARRTAAAYRYDSATAALLHSRQTTSEGDTLITMYRYARQYLPPGGAAVTDAGLQYLAAHNLLTRPIEILRFIKKKNAADSLLAGASWYKYDSGRLQRIYSLPVHTPVNNYVPGYLGPAGLVKDSRYETEATILAADAWGNPQTVQDRAGINALVWDAQQELVTAKVTGAAATDVAYTSFEGSNGSWQVPGLPATAGLTGRKSYPLAAGSITRAVDAGKTYTVSLWATGGIPTVNGGPPTRSGPTLKGFTLYEWTVSGAAQLTIAGAATIDELRLHPAGALMTTFTYEPLTGISTQCDAAHNMVHYEYDALGRLLRSRDAKGSILKQYNYQYQVPVNPNLE